MFDRDLAVLLRSWKTRSINQVVKRNIERFLKKNTFQLDKDEAEAVQKLKPVILNDSGNLRRVKYQKLPSGSFTEQGANMLASCACGSETAIRVSLKSWIYSFPCGILLENGDLIWLSNVEVKLFDQDIKISKQDSKIPIRAKTGPGL